MTDAERAGLRALRDRMAALLEALNVLLGDEPEGLRLGTGGLCPMDGQHEFRLLDATYGLYVCAHCGAQEIREG